MSEMPNKNQCLRLSLRDKILDVTTPQVMGILNTTPDSFSDGGKYVSVEKALDRLAVMIDEGANIIDIGGESTRPGAELISGQEEIDRVLPVMERAIENFPTTLFSVDTTKYRVAKLSLECGAHIINDVSGLQKEPRLASLCAEYNAGYVLMHSQGDPKTMQQNPKYSYVIEDIFSFFEQKIKKLEKTGVSSVIVDPGIGFGKTVAHNLEIIKELQKFSTLGKPVLLGASRKSVIGKLLNDRPPEKRVAGTIAMHYHSLLNGAKILRVHDVQEAFDSVQIFNSLVNPLNKSK